MMFPELPKPPEHEKETPAALLEMHGPRQRLTEAQRTVLAALASGYSVCMSSSSVADHEAVMLGNGSRYSAITAYSLAERELIEIAGVEREPPPRPDFPNWWRKELRFFHLTEQGRNEVIRQYLRFDPREVLIPLPCRISQLQEAMAHYTLVHGCEPEVALRGTAPSERLGWCARLSDWRRVISLNATENLLGLAGGEDGTDENTLLWVRPDTPGWHHTTRVRVRLRPDASANRTTRS